MSKRVRSHAVSIGPEGRRELSSIDLLNESQENADRYGDKASGHHDSEDKRKFAEDWSMTRMIDPEGLEHAPHAVPQVETQQDHAEDVPGRNVSDLKTANRIAVHIALLERAPGMDNSHGEMQKVINDEREQDGTAPIHGPRGVRRNRILSLRVAYGAGGKLP